MSKSRKFLWNDQVRDNMFWTIVSAGTIWTGFEVLMHHAYARGFISFINPRENPVAFVVDPLACRRFGITFTSIGGIVCCM